MARLSATSAALLLLTATNANAGQIGFRQFSIDTEGARPLNISLWYPTDEKAPPPTIVGENPIFLGAPAMVDATPDQTRHHLIVLSHGYSSSWRNLSCLAAELAENGYVVAAPDHPGTTTFNRDPVQAAILWERPRDLSRTIDAVLADPALGPVTPDQMTPSAILWAAGRWQRSPKRGSTPGNSPTTAKAISALAPVLSPMNWDWATLHLAKTDLRDPRLVAFVTLDLGFARGFTAESLASIKAPALVIGAGIDIGGLPATLESGWLAEHLPRESTHLVMIPHAMHFSFMQRCKEGAEALIEAETPGDEIVCHDSGGRNRIQIHREVVTTIIRFLDKVLPPG
ncbi:lipoprotein signal peptide [Breoghania sp.]|uniref:alpha/beta hydrolase family protein n=1 Tax=Breoghania sp. TaxID=2065378 RepID=UPI002630915F|nr:lipoprotein signal peptide [Breoghania sp.]MDJ0931121.1 lipoprotein signal peptide [Breoghania sp.]